MIKPAFLEPGDQFTTVGHVFAVPLVVKGRSGLPLLELLAWGVLSRVARNKHPTWSLRKQVSAGAITAVIVLGSEWSHNLAHTAIASWIGKPVDAIRILWGTPLLVYYDINDQQVTPRQHIIRSLGGPVFNALIVPLAWLARHFTHQGSFARYLSDFALGTNIFLSTVSLLPIPGIDGGPLLKWSLVEAGRSVEQADEFVQGVNRLTGAGLAAASVVAAKKRRKWLAGLLAAFAATSLAIGIGLVKEQE